MAPNDAQPVSAAANPPVLAQAPAAAQPAAASVPAAPAADALATTDAILALPVTAVGRIDVGRLLREVEALDAFLAQAAVREPGTPLKMPRTTKVLDDMLQMNTVNFLLPQERARLLHFLMEVYGKAPVVHMSFSADPSPQFLVKLMTWLRQEVHPLVLLQVGMQPNIGAGCIVRTTNKYFDFSLRNRFHERRMILAHRLKGFTT